MCQTDLKAINGFIPSVVLPRIIGHELAGEVVALGPGVVNVRVGDRVASQLDIWCEVCDYCKNGRFEYCSRLRRLGLERDGGHADLVCLPVRNLLPLPDEVSFEQGAAVPDAIGSAFHSIRSRADLRPGQTIAIYGLGGLGLNAVQIAAITGASRIIGIARTPERRSLALDLGATDVIDPDAGLVPTIRDVTDGMGVDAFIDLVGIEGSVEQAAAAVKKGGRVVVVGYKVPVLSAQTMNLVLNEVQIMGSRSSTRGEQLEAIGLIAAGKLRSVVARRIPLENVNDAYQDLAAGMTIGRSVITLR
jgi:D-arabinose 1-dehydrogenase-like Zn-dependent alcohol dehydrogenase